MPTYGKRRKGIPSSLAASQDEETDQSTSRYASSYARLENVKTAFSRTRSRVKLDNRIGGDEPSDKKSPTSVHAATVTSQLSNEMTDTKLKYSDERLSKVPLTLPLAEDHKQTIPPSQSTTSKQPSETPQVLTHSLSLPFANGQARKPNESMSRPATGSTLSLGVHDPLTTLAGASELQSKITDLMQQAAIQENDTKRKAELHEAQQLKMSPFRWGKNVFVKATHAIRDRLSNQSRATPLSLGPYSQSHVRLNHSSDTSSIYDTNEGDIKKRLNRRIAEGRNLANPKIQTMVGDGNIPRKPLPVYESMKSRSLRSGSEDDPFSDGHEAQASVHSQKHGKLDIDFNKRSHEDAKAKDRGSRAQRTANGATHPQNHSPDLRSTSRFSNRISGLAQHPNVMEFSSSPLGFSTPRARLEPPFSSGDLRSGLKQLSRSPSIIEFSFEGRSDDEKSIAPSTNSRSFTDGSQSVKRKSAHSDLRSPTIPLSKKSKLGSFSSNEEASLAMGMIKVDTEEEKLPLSTKDKNTKVRSPGAPSIKGRGLTIFELDKGKRPDPAHIDETRKARPRPIIGRKSSLPRPSSMLLSGRESRPGMRRLTSIDTEMDIDELQIQDTRYHVGGKRI